MCYYKYQKQLVFFSLDTLMAHANRMRHYYHLSHCDISGGEATIYGPLKDGRRPDLEALVRHCANIGLKPTIITHAQNNTEVLVQGIEEAGLEDWLVSIHGLERGHDATVLTHQGCGDGGWKRLVQNLAHSRRPIRFNTTIQGHNYRELPGLAQWLSDNRPATCWNAILFNPFFAWAGKEVIEFQERISVVAPFVGDAVRIMEAHGWEVNVRYFPPCAAEKHGFAKNCVGFYGTQFDHWEWSLAATNKAKRAQAPGGWHDFNLRYCDGISMSRENDVCKSCSRFGVSCEGPSEQYQKRFGTGELIPYV